MSEMIKYPNGLRLVIQPIKSVRSQSTGFWVGAGSSKENNLNNGISHFIEHMMFKGTQSMNPFDIAKAFENLGAAVNAFTSKECTCYYLKSIDDDAEKCFELLSQLFFDSVFKKEELDKERHVIVEEINMVEDSPEDICYDELYHAMYKKHALGQTILGPIDNVLRFEKSDIKEYMDNLYNPDNIVISMAGNVSVATADSFVRKYFLPNLKDKPTSVKNAVRCEITSAGKIRNKDFEQSNIGIAFPSLRFNAPGFATQAILNMLLGGGMSSRLFQTIREQLGLAYSVYSSPSSFYDNGSFNIYLNISPNNTYKAVKAVKEELIKLTQDGCDKDEFLRAKAQIKSALVYSEESTQSVMTSQGKLMLMANSVYNLNERLNEIEAVTQNDVNDFVRSMINFDKICSSYVGKEIKDDVLQILKS